MQNVRVGRALRRRGEGVGLRKNQQKHKIRFSVFTKHYVTEEVARVLYKYYGRAKNECGFRGATRLFRFFAAAVFPE